MTLPTPDAARGAFEHFWKEGQRETYTQESLAWAAFLAGRSEVSRAVAEEREACAKIADRWVAADAEQPESEDCSAWIARLPEEIRARSRAKEDEGG